MRAAITFKTLLHEVRRLGPDNTGVDTMAARRQTNPGDVAQEALIEMVSLVKSHRLKLKDGIFEHFESMDEAERVRVILSFESGFLYKEADDKVGEQQAIEFSENAYR